MDNLIELLRDEKKQTIQVGVISAYIDGRKYSIKLLSGKGTVIATTGKVLPIPIGSSVIVCNTGNGHAIVGDGVMPGYARKYYSIKG